MSAEDVGALIDNESMIAVAANTSEEPGLTTAAAMTPLKREKRTASIPSITIEGTGSVTGTWPS
jgi:hypothetical protein